jgi:hypothetical protein
MTLRGHCGARWLDIDVVLRTYVWRGASKCWWLISLFVYVVVVQLGGRGQVSGITVCENQESEKLKLQF